MKKITILVFISLISFPTLLRAEESVATEQVQAETKDSNSEAVQKPDPSKVAAFAEQVRAKLKAEGVKVADSAEPAQVVAAAEPIRAELKEADVKVVDKVEAPEVVSTIEQARAELKNTNGDVVGRAVFYSAQKGVRVRLEVTDLSEGDHAFHIHDIGNCSDAEFKSAGPHLNPENKKHGMENPEGHHMGDLPNVAVGANGKGAIEALIEGATFGEGPNSLLDADGTSVVVHADADDHMTDPAGNAGKRIACGVITK